MRSIRGLCVVMLVAAVAAAQEPEAAVDPGAVAAEEGEDEGPGSPFSFSLGVDFPSQYLFRGILSENQGVIAEPWMELGARLHEDEESWISSVGLTLGTWHSIHSGPTGSDVEHPGPDAWYESDFSGGLSVGLFGRWEVGVTFSNYASPNESFEDIEEVMFGLSWDDAGLWEDLGLGGWSGLQPHLTLAIETEGQSDVAEDEGTYFEVGIEPVLKLLESEVFTLDLALPVAAGFSLDDYYEYEYDNGFDDDSFGFFEAGARLDVGLGFVPECLGSWTVSAAVRCVWLGDNAATMNIDDDYETIVSAGLAITF